MGNEESKVKEELLGLERLLLENIVRCNAHRISQILDQHFKEYTSSGKIYVYRKGDIFGKIDENVTILVDSDEMITLSDDVRMILYKVKK